MTLLPGWDSSGFVRTAHRNLEFISIIGFVVCAGCEFVKHINPSHGRLVERLVIGSFLFAAFMELVAFPYGERNDELAREQANKQEFAISELSSEAQKALGNAKKALSDSNSAVSKAANAEAASGRAVDKSTKAEGTASSAMTLARGARKEADSFESDIKSAKDQSVEAKTLAGEAKALLSDVRTLASEAQQRASEASAGVNRINMPRSLINTTQLVSALEPFTDAEYTFSCVFQDEEAIRFLKDLDALFMGSGWKRVKPPGGFPAINVFGKDIDFSVPACLNTGISVSVDSEQPVASLQALPLAGMPMYLRAAIALNLNLPPAVSPPHAENVGKTVEVLQGTSKTVRVAVGKKP
jgi:uncharacterized protein YbjQ (UPF0145 family)